MKRLMILCFLLTGCDQDDQPKVKTEHALDWVKPYTKASYCPKCAPITPDMADGIHIKDTLSLSEKQALIDWEVNQKQWRMK